jgi:hypothetical protein
MTKQQIKKMIYKDGWYKTSQNMKTQEDRKLFLEVADEFHNCIEVYKPFGLVEA